MEKALRTCICKAAYEHIGLKKVSNKTPMWMTTEIEEAIKQRNEAKQSRHNDESRYKEADEKVKDLITEKKKEIWKRKVLDSQEAGNVWQMVRNLKDGPRECKNKAIIHNNKTRVTDRQKARAFMSHYKKRSNITLKKEDRWAKKAVNEHLRKPTCDTEHEREFTLKELKSALSSVDRRKAAGPDKIHPRMLKKLGPSALAYLLDLFNNVWKTSQVPQMWRTADIRPIPKKGKELRDVGSFRPISLTSVVGKLMERMVCTRLRHFLESNNLLNPNQAGFRSKRSTEDQLLCLSQTVSDEFQKKPMHRTVLALVDYSRAFDTVWRDALLWKMIQKGIGTRIIRWTQSWLSNGWRMLRSGMPAARSE